MLPDTFIDEVFADIERLTSRNYAEVGVPMFLIAEDLSSGAAAPTAPVSPHHSAMVATEFDQVWAAIVARKPDLDAVDISRAIEVFADRYILRLAASEFTHLIDEATDV